MSNDSDKSTKSTDGIRYHIDSVHSDGGGLSIGGNVYDHRKYGAVTSQLDSQTLAQIKQLLDDLASQADQSPLERGPRGKIMSQAEEAVEAIEKKESPHTLLERLTALTKTVQTVSTGVTAAAPLYEIAKHIARLANIQLP